MRIGIYGGSFDPFHNGHQAMVRSALASGYVDCVIAVPSVRNSFKRYTAVLAAPYRYYMTLHAAEKSGLEGFYVSDVEFGIEGVSYTAVMLSMLTDPVYISRFLQNNGVSCKAASEKHSYYWIMGSDTLATFEHWYRPETILKYVTLLAAVRPGDDTDIVRASDSVTGNFGGEVEFFRLDGVNCSSYAINSTGDFACCHDAVREFIYVNSLYKDNTKLANCSEIAREQFFDNAVTLYPELKEKRLLHTLNVGILSAHLAGVYGADADKALIAGQLHDCVKEKDIEEQRRLAESYSGDLFADKKLLHWPGGATYARDHYGVSDCGILDAICYHTTGRGNMTLLEKMVYLADKIEPSRTYTDLSDIRKAAETDLDEAMRMTSACVVAKFRKQGRELHPLTGDMMRDLGL